MHLSDHDGQAHWMTISKDSPTDCFVYITLPEKTKPITAGRFSLKQDRRGTNVGQFVYGRNYRDNPDAAEIDPAELQIAARTYETAAMRGMPSRGQPALQRQHEGILRNLLGQPEIA
ncbi:hypothetical protein AB4Z52_15665 [Rhizobium sp. 2YAF20]|uniref:hypothetical protein n=1 Tax=Rhizobium sp. 2YAF20 TaxID=3233027 RepID=UPI003F9C5C9C